MADQRRDFKYTEEDAADWVRVLRFGSEQDKVPARWLLAEFFERRGQIDEAVELHETNMKFGIFVGDNVEKLADLYKSQDRSNLATELEWDYMILSDEEFLPSLAKKLGRKALQRMIGDFADCVQPLSKYLFSSFR